MKTRRFPRAAKILPAPPPAHVGSEGIPPCPSAAKPGFQRSAFRGKLAEAVGAPRFPFDEWRLGRRQPDLRRNRSGSALGPQRFARHPLARSSQRRQAAGRSLRCNPPTRPRQLHGRSPRSAWSNGVGPVSFVALTSVARRIQPPTMRTFVQSRDVLARQP